MKNLMLVLVVLSVLLVHNLTDSTNNQALRNPASTNKENPIKLNKYIFTYKNLSLELIKKENENSFSEAAKECYNYFNQKITFNKESAIDIIDSCVNPKVE